MQIKQFTLAISVLPAVLAGVILRKEDLSTRQLKVEDVLKNAVDGITGNPLVVPVTGILPSLGDL
ncbi:hypothetical protein PM082_006693 [Marasmius tenuissimus]|nr:hypothetical protein PM082_006693 [Marasmius tenuissimus]